MLHTASCKCGKTEFELRGKPVIQPNCACNDCVVAGHYVDWKAKEAGIENQSVIENGNPQFAQMIMWPSSCIKVVKGKENMLHFKLRNSSKTARCYTSCCFTTVVCFTGKSLPTLRFGIPMNRATISPPIPALYRINCGELVDRNAVTNVEKLSMSDTFPPSLLYSFICAMCFGTGGKTKDADTFALLSADVTQVSDVAGPEAYKKCGFDSSLIN